MKIIPLMVISLAKLANFKSSAIGVMSDEEAKQSLTIKDDVIIGMAKSLLSHLESKSLTEIDDIPAAEDVLATIVQSAFAIGDPISIPHYTAREEIDQEGMEAFSKIIDRINMLLNLKYVVENEYTYQMLSVNLRSILYGLLNQLQDVLCKYFLCVYGTCTLRGMDEVHPDGLKASTEGMWKNWDSRIHQKDLFYGVANSENDEGLPSSSLSLGKQHLANAVFRGSLQKDLPPIGSYVYARYIFTPQELNYMTYLASSFKKSDSKTASALKNELLFCRCYKGISGSSCVEFNED